MNQRADQTTDADAWRDYLAAARRLDAVRVTAATAASEQAQAVQVARSELTGVRARLAAQQSRLRQLGVPREELLPTEPEVAAAALAMADSPAGVLAALRQTEATIRAVEAEMPAAAAADAETNTVTAAAPRLSAVARAAGAGTRLLGGWWPPTSRRHVVLAAGLLAVLVGVLALVLLFTW